MKDEPDHYIKLNYKLHNFHIKNLENIDISIPSLKFTTSNEMYFYKELIIFKSPINKNNTILEFTFHPALIDDTNEIIFKIIDYILNNNIAKYMKIDFGIKNIQSSNWICTFKLINKELLLQLL